MVVLKLKLCLRNLMLDYCSDLTTDWNIGSTCFLNCRALEIKVSFKADLVEEYIDVLTLEPLTNLKLTSTTCTLTHVKLKGKLLRLFRVVVAPDHQVFLIDTLEFFLPYFYLF